MVSARDPDTTNNSKRRLNLFQVHGALCHRHAHDILSRHENTNTEGDLSSNTNVRSESSSPYIIISPSMRIRLIEGSDRRTHNLPTMEEAAAVICIGYNDRSVRDIILALRRRDRNDNIRQGYDFEQHFQRISQTHAAYIPSHYVLLFPRGTYGWHWYMRLSSFSTATITATATNEELTSTRQRDRLSQRTYYRFRLHLRGEHEFPAIFYAKKLFQQYLVDAWAICDQNKLDWIRHNQDRLRADVYNGLADAIAESDQINATDLGRRFTLPSSFHRELRFMSKLYYDFMAIAIHYFLSFDIDHKTKVHPKSMYRLRFWILCSLAFVGEGVLGFAGDHPNGKSNSNMYDQIILK